MGKKAKGMTFGAESVRAILGGTKTMTRRVIASQPPNNYILIPRLERNVFLFGSDASPMAQIRGLTVSSFYKVGDIIYVKEACSDIGFDEPTYVYKATDGEQIERDCQPVKWRSPRYMPKAAARIWLQITGVRVERLQEISPQDCHAEGIMNDICADCLKEYYCRPQCDVDVFCGGADGIIDDYAGHWDEINGKRDKGAYKWDSNCWVWVYEFERIGEENAD